MITQQGSLNTTALVVPDLYIQIVPPQVTLLNGVPTNILGVVGTACWGPVNVPVPVVSMSDYAQKFGALQNRTYDMGTAVAVAVLQGAANFRCVRVTDGTDLAATVTVLSNCMTFTAKYSGTLGNSLTVTLSAGSQSGTQKVVVSLPGLTPEVFDNIGSGLSGGMLWGAIASAINNGTSTVRGPSGLIVATVGAGVTAPAAASYGLSGGTDGALAITSAILTGQDSVPRKGMYALRNTGVSIALLSDLTDPATWTAQAAFGLTEGVYMILSGAPGDTIANATAIKMTSGLDSYAVKLMFGDWIYWMDPVNGLTRLVSPQGFVAGRLANLSPEQSSLNKPLYGVVATQKSAQNATYASAELQMLAQAGIDLITNPVPGGSYFGVRIGHNASSNAVTNGDNYTRMTNYLASTLNAGMGVYVGQLQSPAKDDPLRGKVRATLDNFLSNMGSQNQIAAWQVVCDLSNNPVSRIALGYLQADVRIQYLSVVEKFLVNMEGGQSVSIIRQSTRTS